MRTLILLLIISVGLIGCSKEEEDYADWEPTTYETVNNLDGVVMIVKERVVSSKKLTVILENSSNFPLFPIAKPGSRWYNTHVNR